MSSMKKISLFAQKVLDFIVPDRSRQEQFVQEPELCPISQSEAMMRFVRRIEQAKQNGEKVLIAGDYDCDGILATYILKTALEAGGLQTGYYIPSRCKEGYGLSAKTVSMAKERGYSLIVTVDNGVQAKDALKEAREQGIDVIVTDHHTITDPIDAGLVVHPDFLEAPFATLCGAGVAYECARALQVDSEQMLILVAVASVADCMPVTGQTRAIISQGLEAFNRHPEPHLQPFVRGLPINETDVSFQIAPRINSIGRLSERANANTFVRYLESSDPRTIEQYAAGIEHLNEERKSLSLKTCAMASALISPHRKVLLAMDPSFHEGVIGLAAGSLCSKYRKPVIVATKTDEGYKGSMRAPEGFSCLPFLAGFDGFSVLGGHDRAAGFTVRPERWHDFENYILEQGIHLGWTPTPPRTLPIGEEEISVANARALDSLRPFGTGFEQPLFSIEEPAVASVYDFSGGKHRRYVLDNSAQMLLFNMTDDDRANKYSRIEKAEGTLSLSSFRGQTKADFIVSGIEYQPDEHSL